MATPKKKTGKKLAPRYVRAFARKAKAFEMRIQGYSYAAIGKELGITYQGAFDLVSRELEERAKQAAETAEQVRHMELDRLDRMLLGILPDAEAGNSRAVDSCLRISDRRAKLLGLDAAVKQDVSISAVDDARESLAARLAAVVAKRNAGPDPSGDSEPQPV